MSADAALDCAPVQGFLVPCRELPRPTVTPSLGARAAMVQGLAAMLVGLTPEDAAQAIETGCWPRPVAELLGMPWEPEELSAWLDVVLALGEQAAASEG